METREFRYEVAMVVVFTREELDLIAQCCRNHYDAKVQRAAGGGGFLYGWLNMLRFDEQADRNKDGYVQIEITCRFSELDTCGKALEQPAVWQESEGVCHLRSALWYKITQILKAINVETHKVNTAALENITP